MLRAQLIVVLLLTGTGLSVQAAVENSEEAQHKAMLQAEADRDRALTRSHELAEKKKAAQQEQERQLYELRHAPDQTPITSRDNGLTGVQSARSGKIILVSILVLLLSLAVSVTIITRREMTRREAVRQKLRSMPIVPSELLMRQQAHAVSDEVQDDVAANTARILRECSDNSQNREPLPTDDTAVHRK